MTVVRRRDGVDLVARLDEHLIEDRRCLLVVPAGHELIRALLERAVLVERVQDRVIPALEQVRVRIGAAAVQLGDDRMLRVLPVRLQAVDDALALQDADCLAVERVVDLGHAADYLAVVVDRRNALRKRGLLDRGRRARVEGDLDDDLGAVAKALVGLRRLLLGIVVSVVELRRDSVLLELRLQSRRVVMHPPDGGRRVRHQDTDVAARGLLGNAGRRTRDDQRGKRTHDDDDGAEHRRPTRQLPHAHSLPLMTVDCTSSIVKLRMFRPRASSRIVQVVLGAPKLTRLAA